MKSVEQFENTIAEFYGSKYAVAVDCCTHAIELCLRVVKPDYTTVPSRTYLSIPMTLKKLGIKFQWSEEDWTDYYYLGNTEIIDAAVCWKKGSYVNDSLMCLSFQYKKHLSLGRGGMILTNNRYLYDKFKKLSYDGRQPNIPWAEQNIDCLGYHYYMTPETAEQGLLKFHQVKDLLPKKWTYNDYPDLRNMSVFNA